jgi:hypothetical protein
VDRQAVNNLIQPNIFLQIVTDEMMTATIPSKRRSRAGDLSAEVGSG